MVFSAERPGPIRVAIRLARGRVPRLTERTETQHFLASPTRTGSFPTEPSMRLAAKFALALTAGLVPVLTIQGAVHLGQIASLQERELRDDVLIFARTLSIAAGDLWAAAGRERARSFLRRVDARRDKATIRLLEGSGLERPENVPMEPRVTRVSRRDGWHVEAIAPVQLNGEVVAALEIERRFPSERSYYASILWTQLGTTVAAAIVSGLIAFLTGLWLIGRPIRKLSELAHRVAAGDFALRTSIPQRDEIGRLSQELNRMSEQLAVIDTKSRRRPAGSNS